MKFGLKKLNVKKDITILLVAVIMLHLSAYLVIPVLPVIFKTEKGLNASNIGVILAANSFAFQFGSIITGLISDRIGKKATMIIGLLLQAMSVTGYALTNNYLMIVTLSFINGTGNGIYAPTIKAAIATLTSESADTRTTAFSLRGIAANIGISIAGIILFFLAGIQSSFIFFLAGIVFILLAAYIFFFLPKKSQAPNYKRISLNTYKIIFQNKAFLIFSILIILVSAVFAQLQLLLPLRAESVLNNGRIVGTIWTIISIQVILTQTFISKFFLRKLKSLSSIFWSFLFFAGGIILIGFSDSFFLLTLSAIVFTIGQMFMMPTVDSVVGQLAHTELIGAYFSITNLLSGLGFAIGTYVAGKLINTFGVDSTIYPWLLITIGTLSFAVVTLFIKKFSVIDKSYAAK